MRSLPRTSDVQSKVRRSRPPALLGLSGFTCARAGLQRVHSTRRVRVGIHQKAPPTWTGLSAHKAGPSSTLNLGCLTLSPSFPTPGLAYEGTVRKTQTALQR